MRVLMLTRRVDADDWLVGFTYGWVRAIAEHPAVDRLDVLCLETGRYEALPAKVRVYSMGKELGYSRPRLLWEATRRLIRLVREADVIFGHMIPLYTLVAAPWSLLFRVPIVQWYTHRQVTWKLRLVHALAARIVTASAESFQLPSRKVTVLGHGIDMAHFSRREAEPASRLIVAVGRLSPIKHYESLIDGAAQLVKRPGMADVQVKIAGGLTPEQGEAYREGLLARIADHSLEGTVHLLGAIPHGQIDALYREAALSVNLCPTGGVDKAVLESMAVGLPVVVHNQTFLPMLGEDGDPLWTEDLDPVRLADRLEALLKAGDEERRAIGTRLSEAVRAGHSLEGLVDRLIAVLGEAAGR
jgi:glycosyltransferase involved in cell wall biosynthesis